MIKLSLGVLLFFFAHLTSAVDQHTLTIKPDSAELLLSQRHPFTLSLTPNLVGESTVTVKFDCEDGEGHKFNWNDTDPGCGILSLVEGYVHTLHGNDTTLNLTVAASSTTPGKKTLVAHVRDNETRIIDTSHAYITVNIGRSKVILTISSIVGWIYFAAWSISFWPQIWENFKRRSVVGLNFDYVALNITGFLSYTAFNVALKFIPKVEKEFFQRHPRSQNPIELNDVVFGVHAVFATFVVIIQCLIYERGTQTVSWFSRIFLAIVWAGYIIIGIVIQFADLISLLDFIYVFSYVKLVITLIKYIPQGYFNYKRKSTVGWSIANIFLDFTGGALSMFQMFLLAYNYDDWVTIFNNFTKFGLGFISILFDVFFMLQHYVFYRNRSEHSSHSALLGEGDAGHSIGRPGYRGSDAFDSEKMDASIPSLVPHVSYGSTEPINTNDTMFTNGSSSSSNIVKSPSWTQSPHPVIN